MMCNALDSRTIRLLENVYIYMVKLNDYTDIKQSLTPAGENVRSRKYMYSAGIFWKQKIIVPNG